MAVLTAAATESLIFNNQGISYRSKPPEIDYGNGQFAI